MAKFELAIPMVFKHEGGYVNDPNDPGGATNYGISLRYLKTLGDLDNDGFLNGDLDQDGDVDIDDIKKFTPQDALVIYKTQWWDRYNYAQINDQAIATKIFDLAINMGAGRSHKLAQEALNDLGTKVKVDGILGKISINAINSFQNNTALLEQIKRRAARFYYDLNRPRFLKGWLRRAYA